MRFTTAALTLLAVAPTAEAFVPTKSSGVLQQQHSTFAVRQRFPFLRSTTEDKKDVEVNLAELEKLVQSPPKEVLSKSEPEPAYPKTADEVRNNIKEMLSQYEGKNGAYVIYSKLLDNGVSVVNGFSGGAVLPLLDQFHEDHPRHKEKGARKPIRWLTNSNENSAGHIAEGYAKALPLNQDRPPIGVVVATSGPAVTNLITPLQDAICDGVPIMVLCGQAATVAPPDAFQQAPAVDLCKPCTKWSYQIKSAAELPLVMDYAFFIATHGRPGPVFIDLPKDLQNQIITKEIIDSFVDNNLFDRKAENFARMVEGKTPNGQTYHAVNLGYDGRGLPFYIEKKGDVMETKPVTHSIASDLYHVDHHATNRIYRPERHVQPNEPREGALSADDPIMKDMLKLISKAKKPIIVAGQGCNDASEELKAFAEKLQIPVATTLHALGCFDERNPLALNMIGMHGHATPNFMVQDADLLICIGSRFDDRITGRLSDFVPQARKAAEEGRGGVIHVDIRYTEMSKQVEPTFFVHSTGKNFLKTFNDVLAKNSVTPTTGPWLAKMRGLQKDFPVKIPHFPTEQVEVTDQHGLVDTVSRTPMSAQSVIAKMNAQLLKANKLDDCIFTTGVGVHQMIAAQLITWTQPRQMLSSGSLGTMGVSLGYVIGAKLAQEDKYCISVDGDGSFNMTFTELKSLIEHGIPVKLLILDNDGQMMVEYWQRLFHDNRLLAVRNSANPDYVKLAHAFGIDSVYCDCEEHLDEKMREFLFGYDDKPVLFHARIQRTPCLPMVAPGQPLEDMILEDVDIDVDGAAAPS